MQQPIIWSKKTQTSSGWSWDEKTKIHPLYLLFAVYILI